MFSEALQKFILGVNAEQTYLHPHTQHGPVYAGIAAILDKSFYRELIRYNQQEEEKNDKVNNIQNYPELQPIFTLIENIETDTQIIVKLEVTRNDGSVSTIAVSIGKSVYKGEEIWTYREWSLPSQSIRRVEKQKNDIILDPKYIFYRVYAEQLTYKILNCTQPIDFSTQYGTPISEQKQFEFTILPLDKIMKLSLYHFINTITTALPVGTQWVYDLDTSVVYREYNSYYIPQSITIFKKNKNIVIKISFHDSPKTFKIEGKDLFECIKNNILLQRIFSTAVPNK